MYQHGGYRGGSYSSQSQATKGETKGSISRPAVEVVLSRWVWELMHELGREFSPQECGGLLVVEDGGWQDNGRLRLNVNDLVFPEQEGSGANVEWEETDEIAFLKREDVGAWPGQPHTKDFPIWGKWHTHPGMGVFWSATDESTLVKNSVGPGLLVNVVIDPAKGEVLSRVDCAVRSPGWPRGKHLWAEWPSTTLVERVQYDGMDEAIAEAKAKFNSKPVVVQGYGGSYQGKGSGSTSLTTTPSGSTGSSGTDSAKGGGTDSERAHRFRARAKGLSTQTESKIKNWLEPEDILYLSDDRLFRHQSGPAMYEIAMSKGGDVLVRRGDVGVMTRWMEREFKEWWELNFPRAPLGNLLPTQHSFKLFHMSPRLGGSVRQVN